MEETGTVETLGAETQTVKDALVQAASGELSGETFRRIAEAACEDRKSFDGLKEILQDWDEVAGSLGPKATSDVVYGYCLMITGQPEAAAEVFKANKRNDWALLHGARMLLQNGYIKEALKWAKDGNSRSPDFDELTYVLVEALAVSKEFEDAAALVEQLEKKHNTAELYVCKARSAQAAGDYRDAVDLLRHALTLNEEHQEALFLLGFLIELYGTDAEEANDEAVEIYERCVKQSPVHSNAVINLGLLYEDRERYHDSIKCYETVLRYYPNHARARMYLGDAQAATRMFYDKDQEKKADRQSQVLKIPVTDFELSVRSRNCLQKMNIKTLGDLIMKTEQELLSYKNFGETSLEEIKVMLGQKGLRLGQGLEEQTGDQASARNPLEATASPDVLNRSIDELDLSVRSRRCMERLGVRTVRELINKTEVELMAAKNFGMTSLNEIKRKLSELGLGLRA